MRDVVVDHQDDDDALHHLHGHPKVHPESSVPRRRRGGAPTNEMFGVEKSKRCALEPTVCKEPMSTLVVTMKNKSAVFQEFAITMVEEFPRLSLNESDCALFSSSPNISTYLPCWYPQAP